MARRSSVRTLPRSISAATERVERSIPYSKNLDYSYHYVEPETAHSLLYSRAHDDCVMLDPMATTLWEQSGDLIDLNLAADAFVKVFGVTDAAGYLSKIARGMCQVQCRLVSRAVVRRSDVCGGLATDGRDVSIRSL